MELGSDLLVRSDGRLVRAAEYWLYMLLILEQFAHPFCLSVFQCFL